MCLLKLELCFYLLLFDGMFEDEDIDLKRLNKKDEVESHDGDEDEHESNNSNSRVLIKVTSDITPPIESEDLKQG